MFVTGDKVVLVDDKWPAFIAMYDNVPIKNKTYTVRDVRLGRTNLKNGDNPEDDTDVAITLEGVTNGPDPLCESGLVELAFKAIRFRKVDEIKAQWEERNAKEKKITQPSFL